MEKQYSKIQQIDLKHIVITLAKVVYGLLLPLYLLWFVFFNHYQYQREEVKNQFREKLENSLEISVETFEDKDFFHYLLKTNAKLADKHNKPLKLLETRIRRLKKTFPHSMKFIVWNKQGNIVDNLSDESRYRYVLKTMFKVMQKVKKHCLSSNAGQPQNLKLVQDKLTLLRGFFGQFLLPDKFVEFFKMPTKGKAITVSEKLAKRIWWYYSGTNFSMSCFISTAVLNRQVGPKLVVENFNRNKSLIRLGFFTTPEFNHSGLPSAPADIAELKIETHKFEKNAVAFRETNKFLILFRQVSPDLIFLSYCRKKQVLPEAEHSAHQTFAKAVAAIAIAGFVIYAWLLVNPDFYFSVAQKILFLLLFANGLPALVLLSAGYQYFTEKRASLVDERQQKSVKIMRELDARFPGSAIEIARQLNEFINNHIESEDYNELTEAQLTKLEQFVLNFKPGKMFIMGKGGKTLSSYDRSGEKQAGDFFRDFFARSLEFLNNNNVARSVKKGKSTLEAISSEDLIFLGFNSFLDNVSLKNTAQGRRWTYLKQIGDFENFNSKALLAVLWTPEEFMRAFLNKELAAMNSALYPRKVVVVEKESLKCYPQDFKLDSRLKRLVNKAISRKFVLDENVEIGGQTYLLAGIAGNELDRGILLALFPVESVEKEIFSLKLALFAVGLLILLFLAQIIKLFSRRLLRPVEELAAGMDHLRRQNFDFKADATSQDEFGYLLKNFNSTMTDLKELAVGTAVQQDLLPDDSYTNNNIELFGHSIFMTKMGGDYFDYFEFAPGRLGIFFGDVAGHGIPAAVIMAMAKAVIASSSVSFSGPSDMLKKANQVLLHLRKKKLRRMMTCQCLDFDCVEGQFSIANAGHCYPALVSKNGENVRLLKINGFPLGTKTRKDYEEHSFKLEPGDTLILYTDGIIEAVNSQGEMFDYSRFEALLKSAWSEDLKTYWQRIIAANRNWAVAQDDDLTFLLIRFEGAKDV